MKGGRLATLVAMGLAMFFMFQAGEETALKTFNVARKAMALWDLSTIEKTLKLDLGEDDRSTPRFTPEQMAEIITERLDSTRGSDDGGVDPWGNPYQFEMLDDDGAVFVLYSIGPDETPGPCANDDPASDDICVTLRLR
jgi:hypothetical protein